MIQDRATEAREWFEVATRANGAAFYRAKDAAPQWITDLCRTAHDGMMPDDHKYEYIVDALDALSQCEDADEADDYLSDVDVYTSDLCAWLGSHGERPGYCDRYIEEMGGDCRNIMQAIQGGQWLERRDVLGFVRECLAAQEDVPEGAAR